MARSYNAKPPVKPIGRILYSQYIKCHWWRENPKYKGKEPPEPTYERLHDCKGFSDDRPFSVYLNKDPKDKKPYKVVFHWRNEKHSSFTFTYMGSKRSEMDSDTYYMMDVLEELVSLSAAQKSMRKFATESFAKVNDPPQGEGAKCHNVWIDDEGTERDLRVGDLIEYAGVAGTIWRILGERRASDEWKTQVEPVFSFLVRNGADKPREFDHREVWNHVRPVDLMQMGTAYTMLGNLMKDEAKRRSK